MKSARSTLSTVNNTVTSYRYEYSKAVAKYDGQNNLTARNIYGLNLLMRVMSDTHYYMYNGHADVTALVNAETGAVDGTYYYDAFNTKDDPEKVCSDEKLGHLRCLCR